MLSELLNPNVCTHSSLGTWTSMLFLNQSDWKNSCRILRPSVLWSWVSSRMTLEIAAFTVASVPTSYRVPWELPVRNTPTVWSCHHQCSLDGISPTLSSAWFPHNKGTGTHNKEFNPEGEKFCYSGAAWSWTAAPPHPEEPAEVIWASVSPVWRGGAVTQL